MKGKTLISWRQSGEDPTQLSSGVLSKYFIQQRHKINKYCTTNNPAGPHNLTTILYSTIFTLTYYVLLIIKKYRLIHKDRDVRIYIMNEYFSSEYYYNCIIAGYELCSSKKECLNQITGHPPCKMFWNGHPPLLEPCQGEEVLD